MRPSFSLLSEALFSCRRSFADGAAPQGTRASTRSRSPSSTTAATRASSSRPTRASTRTSSASSSPADCTSASQETDVAALARRPFHHVVARGVEREDAADSHGPITYVTRSVDSSSASAPEGSTKAKVDFVGYALEPVGSNAVKLVRVSQLDVGASASFNPATYKILTTELALAPRRVGAFIDSYGFAPHFLRWGSGPASLRGTSAPGDDVRIGKVTFKVGGDGKGTMQDGRQVSWLAWSGRMYPRGVDLALEPAEAATVSRVETPDGNVLVQLEWSDKVRSDKGATLRLKRADGDGPEDVYLDGNFVDQTISASAGIGSSGGGAAPPKRRQLERRASSSGAPGGGAEAAAAAGLGAAGAVAASKGGAGSSSPATARDGGDSDKAREGGDFGVQQSVRPLSSLSLVLLVLSPCRGSSLSLSLSAR